MKQLAGNFIFPGQEIMDDSLKLHEAVYELLKNPAKLIDQLQGYFDKNEDNALKM